MRNYCLVFFVLFFISCSDKKEEKIVIPNHILSKDQMTLILVDIHILEASLNLNMAGELNGQKKENEYVSIYKKNKTTKKQYEESLYFYSQHPKLLSEVYDDVLSGISKKQVELSK